MGLSKKKSYTECLCFLSIEAGKIYLKVSHFQALVRIGQTNQSTANCFITNSGRPPLISLSRKEGSRARIQSIQLTRSTFSDQIINLIILAPSHHSHLTQGTRMPADLQQTAKHQSGMKGRCCFILGLSKTDAIISFSCLIKTDIYH